MEQHLELLGFRVRDIVSGMEGVVTSISFDLYGCVQAVVNSGLDKDGQPAEGRWFDTKRLIPISKKPVMAIPTFDIVPGGQRLPKYPSQPGM
jgi:hypothetical protein